MKILGTVFIFLGIGCTVWFIWANIKANYQWENSVYSNWTLSDKSSTLEAKSSYMDKFVSALQSSNLADNDALIYKTADNNCANNVGAVETLDSRLNSMKGMDENSLQYQQAISQITGQEQGEATDMINTLNGCWMKTNHYVLWNIWDNTGIILGLSILFGFGIGFCLTDSD